MKKPDGTRSKTEQAPQPSVEDSEPALHTDTTGMPAEEVQQLVHKLRTHQAGLEKQIEGLLQSQAEAALRESEERYRRIVQTAEEGVWTIDAGARTDFVNPKMAQMLGYTVEEMIGRPLDEFMDEAGRAISANNVKRREQGIAERHEFKFQRKDGSDLWTSLSTNPITNSSGVYVGALAMVTDITVRRKAELALQEALNRLQKIASQVPGVIYKYRLRPDGTSCFPYASEAIREIYRVSPEEVRADASKVFAILHPDDREGIVASIQNSARELTPWRHEYRVKFQEGAVRWLFGNSLPQREADGSTVWHGFITDITERRQAQIEREQLDCKLRETQKLESLGVLAGGIAHDFNNILGGILGNASLAEMDLPPESPVQDSIKLIKEASLRAADLCKQMLAYSGRSRFIVEKLNLGQLVEETAQMLQISISKKAELLFCLANGLPPVEVDTTQIRQVIMNLIINASEAIGDEYGVIHISTGLTRLARDCIDGDPLGSGLPDGNYVILEVSDTGCGMSEETRARIFDPFFSTKFTGRGLGLAAVLGIVRGHKGALKVRSEVGRGSTFTLLFPAAADGSESSRAPSPPLTNWNLEGTVLVVDDEEMMRNTVARMMRKVGCKPVLAADGREAIEVFRASPARFTLVLLDLTMPQMDGEQTLTELRQLRPDVRVVLMSGFNAQEALGRFTGKGLAGFLQKPFTIDSLSAVLQKLILNGSSE